MTQAPLRSELMKGAMTYLVLAILRDGEQYGYQIAVHIGERSGGTFAPSEGSLYPALQRLEHRGDIASEWRSTENNRRARYYTITRQGRRALGQEVDRWHRFAAAIGLVLEGRS